MGIQISEKHLSAEAQKALSNAKSKSQFLRDAVEFFVHRVHREEETNITGVKKDLEEIKTMLDQLQKNGFNINQNQIVTEEDTKVDKIDEKSIMPEYEKKEDVQVIHDEKHNVNTEKIKKEEEIDQKLKANVLNSIKQFKLK